MIIFFIVVSAIIGFGFGYELAEKKYEKILWETIASLKKEKLELASFWGKRYRELHELYRRVIEQTKDRDRNEGDE